MKARRNLWAVVNAESGNAVEYTLLPDMGSDSPAQGVPAVFRSRREAQAYIDAWGKWLAGYPKKVYIDKCAIVPGVL